MIPYMFILLTPVLHAIDISQISTQYSTENWSMMWIVTRDTNKFGTTQ